MIEIGEEEKLASLEQQMTFSLLNDTVTSKRPTSKQFNPKL
jgi:hypothetical protein